MPGAEQMSTVWCPARAKYPVKDKAGGGRDESRKSGVGMEIEIVILYFGLRCL